MNNDIDLKELWQKQVTADVPAKEEIFLKAAHLKRNVRNKLIFSIVLLVATIIWILFIWFASSLHLLSTKIGITLMILAILLSIINSIKIVFSMRNNSLFIDNSHYINEMLRLKKQQEFTATKLLTIYYVLLTLGLSLYMYEPASRMKTAGMLITYFVTFTWIAFSWFYLRPRTMKKQQSKTNIIIEKLQQMQENR